MTWDITGVLITVITVLGSVFGTWMVRRSARGKTKADAKTALDARIDARVEKELVKAWAEINELREKVDALQSAERQRTGAMLRILHAIARQWPTDRPAPNLDPDDIALIEDTIPAQWIRPKKQGEQP